MDFRIRTVDRTASGREIVRERALAADELVIGRAAENAIHLLAGPMDGIGATLDPLHERVVVLLRKRDGQLEQIRRHMRLKAMLEVWLYVHVPLTVMLLAALTAHIVSVFYYW